MACHFDAWINQVKPLKILLGTHFVMENLVMRVKYLFHHQEF
jgi:hypothetical protein